MCSHLEFGCDGKSALRNCFSSYWEAVLETSGESAFLQLHVCLWEYICTVSIYFVGLKKAHVKPSSVGGAIIILGRRCVSFSPCMDRVGVVSASLAQTWSNSECLLVYISMGLVSTHIDEFHGKDIKAHLEDRPLGGHDMASLSLADDDPCLTLVWTGLLEIWYLSSVCAGKNLTARSKSVKQQQTRKQMTRHLQCLNCALLFSSLFWVWGALVGALHLCEVVGVRISIFDFEAMVLSWKSSLVLSGGDRVWP